MTFRPFESLTAVPSEAEGRQVPGHSEHSRGMTTHVEFVAILFVLWGALTAVVGVSTFALGVGAASVAASETSGVQVAAGLTAVTFIALAIISILWGAAHVFIGVPLRRRNPRARMLAIVAGSIDLILLPFGTPLGIYVLWVLLNERGKALFGVRYS